MRKLTNPKVIRETGTLYRSRLLVVRFTPKFLEIREKGRREWVRVPWDAAYDLGQKLSSRLP